MPQAFPNESNTWISMTTSTILHLSNYQTWNHSICLHCLPRQDSFLQGIDSVHKAELHLHTFAAARCHHQYIELYISHNNISAKQQQQKCIIRMLKDESGENIWNRKYQI